MPASPDAIAPPADAAVDLPRDQLEAGGADRPRDGADAVADVPADAPADAPPMTADGGDGPAASEAGDGIVRDGSEPDAPDPLCGGAGQPCCHGTECAGAGCCVLGRCLAAGARCWPGVTCAEGSCGGCGGLGQDCCPGWYCTAGGTTCGWNDKCEPCGQAGTKCCVRELLLCPAPGTSCVGDHCEACGQPGQSCCDFRTCAAGGCCVDYHCVGNGGRCGTAGGACTDGRCGACGGAGQPCCGGACHEPGFACGDLGTCEVCGGPHQPSCRLPGEEECHPGAYRVNLTCIPCGQPGTDCCPGNTCDNGGCCWGGSCVANGGICRMQASPGSPVVMHGACLGSRCGGCGRPGQPCCPPDPREHFPPPGVCDPGAACVNETCAACGGAGQPCCADNTCRGGCCVHPPEGVPGQPTCVAGGASCAPHVPGGTCDGATGSCGACGGMAQPCCSGSCTVSNSFCYSVVCRPCGREGWPCCNHTTCDDGSVCIVNTCTRPRL